MIKSLVFLSMFIYETDLKIWKLIPISTSVKQFP